MARSRQKPTALSPALLEEAALSYLNRYDATGTKLATVLFQRAQRASLRLEPELRPDTESVHGWIRDLIERFEGSGLISNRRFAENLFRSLSAKGLSQRAIAQRLRARGVPDEEIERVFGAMEHSDLEAAKVLVRRRRLGPFRKEDERDAHAQKDLARLFRAGFSLDVAQEALR